MPGPGTYEMNKTTVDQRGAKFGKDERGKYSDGKKLSPGPGAYSMKEYLGKEAPKISMVP